MKLVPVVRAAWGFRFGKCCDTSLSSTICEFLVKPIHDRWIDEDAEMDFAC